MNIGIIGLGVIAKYYVAAFKKGVGHNLVAVCDVDAEKMQSFKEQGMSCFTNYEDMFNNDNIEAVIINLPNDLHFITCKRALEMGKHVCCEKPLTLDVQQAELLRHMAVKYQRTLFTSFHRRYNINFLGMLNEIQHKEDIEYVVLNYKEKIEEHAGYDTWYLDPKKCGGGVLADNGPNAFDTAAYFLGPLIVDAADATQDEQGVDLQATVFLRTLQQVHVTINLDWDYPHGELKDIIVRLRDGKVLRADMLEGYDEFKSSLFHEYESVLLDFVRRINGGKEYGDDGIHAVKLVNDAYRLARSSEGLQ